jgi:outer membrane PBP1 activator LpoA protein
MPDGVLRRLRAMGIRDAWRELAPMLSPMTASNGVAEAQ